MTQLLIFNQEEELVLIYNSSSNQYVYIQDELRSYDKDKPLDVAAFRRNARGFTFYKSKDEQSEPVQIDRRLGYSYLGLRTF